MVAHATFIALTLLQSRANLAGSVRIGRHVSLTRCVVHSQFARHSIFARYLRPMRAAFAALSLLGTAWSTAGAQAVAGLGDDAIPLPKGGFRFLLSGLWNDHNAVFAPSANGGNSRRPLLGALATPNFGTDFLPQLTSAQDGIRALSGVGNFALSLGTLETAGEVRQSIAPIAVDYGISRRVSVRLLVPYVESRDATQLILNRTGVTANVGANPAFGTTGAQARAANGALVTQIDQARALLAAAISRCTDAEAMGCDAIRANPAGAQALISRAEQTRVNLVTVYGDATRGGSPVVPINGSPVHAGVLASIGGLRSDFSAYGISTIAAAGPAAATTIYGPAGMPLVGTDSAFAVGYDRLGDTRRAGIGDIDLSATVLLYDTFRADQVERLLTPRRGLRSALTLGWRVGSAGADRPEDAFDVPIGEGANALLLRTTTDLVWSRLLWLSATVRAVQPLGDRMAIAVPARDEASTFGAPLIIADAARTLGTRLDFEIAPRIALGQFFGISGGLLMRRWGADRYAPTVDAESLASTSPVEVPARTLRAAALGVTFSTLASYARGRSRFPAEVLYTHTTALGGSGGVVPAVASDRLELRVYTGFPRR